MAHLEQRSYAPAMSVEISHREALSLISEAELVALKAKASRERGALERRLTDAVRDRFEFHLRSRADVRLHCADSPRLPHVSHVALLGVEAQDLLIRLDLKGYAVSTGSACSSGAVEPSKVLLAMGYDAEEARSSLRVSFGVSNTLEQADEFAAVLLAEAAALRQAAASPLLFA